MERRVNTIFILISVHAPISAYQIHYGLFPLYDLQISSQTIMVLFNYYYEYIVQTKNSVDPDQLASSVASRSGSTLFLKLHKLYEIQISLRT